VNAGRDTPRGPTATELRRRALAVEKAIFHRALAELSGEVQSSTRRCGYCGSMSPHGCPNGPCSFHA
jgi:hypothetical protein